MGERIREKEMRERETEKVGEREIIMGKEIE